MKKNKIKTSLAERFDRIISGSIKQQLICYTIIVLLSLIIFISIGFLIEGNIRQQDDTLGRIAGIMQYFFHAGEWVHEANLAVKIFTGTVSILGMLVFTGLFVAAVSNSIRERIEDIKNGRVVYKNMQNHYVIIGYSGMTISLVDNIFNKHLEKNNIKYIPKIIILTNQDITTVRSNIFSHFGKKFEKKIYFYSGNIESTENLRNSNIDTAEEIYVLGEQNEFGHDIKNFEAINTISNLRGINKNQNVLKVYMQFYSIVSYYAIQKLSIPDDYLCCQNSLHDADKSRKNVFFRPFNFYENTAHLLWGYTINKKYDYDKLDFEPVQGEKYVHLIIIGFNGMGKALLFEALRLCHFPNYVEKNEASNIDSKSKTKISIIDKNINTKLTDFLAEFPRLHQISDIDIEYINASASSKEIQELMTQESLNENALLTIAVCLHDPDASLSVGLNLPDDVYYHITNKCVETSNTRILIRQETSTGVSNIIEKNNKKFKNVHVFGSLLNGMNKELFSDDIPMCISAYFAVRYHHYSQDKTENQVLDEYFIYIDHYIKFNSELSNWSFVEWVTDPIHHDTMMEFALALWVNLSEDFRRSHRDSVKYFRNRNSYSGVQTLSQMEHLHWCAERSIFGYRDTSIEDIKNLDYHLHNKIKPLNTFDVETQTIKEIEKDTMGDTLNRLICFFENK